MFLTVSKLPDTLARKFDSLSALETVWRDESRLNSRVFPSGLRKQCFDKIHCSEVYSEALCLTGLQCCLPSTSLRASTTYLTANWAIAPCHPGKLDVHFSIFWSKMRVAMSRILDISSSLFGFGRLGEPWPLLTLFGSCDSITVR